LASEASRFSELAKTSENIKPRMKEITTQLRSDRAKTTLHTDVGLLLHAICKAGNVHIFIIGAVSRTKTTRIQYEIKLV